MPLKRKDNEERFRNANERLRSRLEGLAWDGRVPFVCECPDPDCIDLVELTEDEYERVRAREHHYLVAPGHEDNSDGRVVERAERFVVIEMTRPASGRAR